MGGMNVMAQGLLAPWVTWLWLAALAEVLIVHCSHFVRMRGQRRWYHASHILMLVSMLYMFASMELTWTWFPSSWFVASFSVSTAAVAGWVIFRSVRHRQFSLLWMLALIMQAAMTYMWLPGWAPALTWTLVVFYGVEALARLAGLPDDSAATPVGHPGNATSAMPGGPPGDSGPAMAVAEREESEPALALGLLADSMPTAVVSQSNREVAVSLAHDSIPDRLSMAVMAASMGYMFAAMQLMR